MTVLLKCSVSVSRSWNTCPASVASAGEGFCRFRFVVVLFIRAMVGRMSSLSTAVAFLIPPVLLIIVLVIGLVTIAVTGFNLLQGK